MILKNRKNLTRLSCLVLALTMLFAVVACDDKNADATEETTAESTLAPTEGTTQAPTTEPTTEPTSEPTSEPTTSAPDVPADPPVDPNVLNVKWNSGYVGSSSNSSYPNKIYNSSSAYYHYTDVITVAKAGTTITFADGNVSDGGDGKYASTSAYVISS